MDILYNVEFEDIILRKIELNDYDNYYDYVTDDLIKKQFLFNHDKDSAKKRLEDLVKRYEEDNKPFVWAIALKDTNEFIGVISFDNIDFLNKSFSIASGIRSKYRGHGYGYKSIKALINYAFNDLDMHRLEITCNVDNIASKTVIEKLGATFEGICRESKYYDNEFKDRRVYSILKREWKNDR